MKTFNLIVSTQFPATHKRKDEKTGFQEKILFTIGCPDCEENQDLSGMNISQCNSCLRHAMVSNKSYSIRKNYPLWKKRIDWVLKGEAILKICYWQLPGGRFAKGNKLIEICQLDKDSGIGVQKLAFFDDHIECPYVYEENGIANHAARFNCLAKNDGLSTEDFKDWFKNYKLDEPLAIIQFTKFRY